MENRTPMDDYARGCVIYYLDGSVFSAGRIRKKIDKIDEQIHNTREDIMLLKTTQDALRKVEVLLKKMRFLAQMAADKGRTTDRNMLDREFQRLKKEIDAVIVSAGYKGANLLDGSFGDINGIITALSDAIP
ncbi:MAG: hypothetical protein LBV27_01115 [Oscillospiraceae bacterium]|nr:hypothetical protein [Oscillospiraceae bacterium]